MAECFWPVGNPLSHAALNWHRRRQIRSTFRDWAAECTDFPGEVCEAALAHPASNKVEAVYRRTDFLEERRLLMAQWAEFCLSRSTLA